MKFILCTECQDVVKVATKEKRYCMCGKVWGQTIDHINIRVSNNHETVVLGFSNSELKKAVARCPTNQKWGEQFLAFVIPKHSQSVHRE